MYIRHLSVLYTLQLKIKPGIISSCCKMKAKSRGIKEGGILHDNLVKVYKVLKKIIHENKKKIEEF